MFIFSLSSYLGQAVDEKYMILRRCASSTLKERGLSLVEKNILFDYSFAMLQIIGTKDNRDYQKTVRFCRERRIPFQEVNTRDYKLSKRELDNIFSSLSDKYDAIDKSSRYYIKNGYEWRDYDPREEVEEHQELLFNPILRNNGKVSLGFNEAFLKESIG